MCGGGRVRRLSERRLKRGKEKGIKVGKSIIRHTHGRGGNIAKC